VLEMSDCVSGMMCVCARVRGSERACVRARVRDCVRDCVRACQIWESRDGGNQTEP